MKNKPEFHIGDRVVTLETFPVVFTVDRISKGPDGKPVYTGDDAPWYAEDQLDYFLPEDQQQQREHYERLVHNTKADLRELKSAGDVLSTSSMPEWFKRWFYGELGRLLGWEKDLTNP